MKIIKAGTKRSAYPWSNRRWAGKFECGTIVELRDDDAEDVNGYRQDQIDPGLELMNVFCPVCKDWHHFYPVSADQEGGEE